MRSLIIGAAGFVGRHLIHCLQKAGWDVAATRLASETLDVDLPVYELDILDLGAVGELLDSFKPDCIFHLAAQSSVALSWKQPALTLDINIKGTLNLLESILKAPARPKTLLIGSGDEYGLALKKEAKIDEETPLMPDSIYAASKVTQGMLGQIYAHAYGLDIVVVRAFNHIGPGQSDSFALSSFCKQVAMIEAGLSEPVIRVGNLDAKRDFTDVRDIAEAYCLLAEKGGSGKVYNVGSGKAVSIGDMLKIILSLSKTDIAVEQDSSRMRPSDIPVIAADTSRLSALTGWSPQISIDITLSDMLLDWRKRVSSGER
jgi:GDP-4-dehydro-6-deoxy-D-mannose reductase